MGCLDGIQRQGEDELFWAEEGTTGKRGGGALRLIGGGSACAAWSRRRGVVIWVPRGEWSFPQRMDGATRFHGSGIPVKLSTPTNDSWTR